MNDTEQELITKIRICHEIMATYENLCRSANISKINFISYYQDRIVDGYEDELNRLRSNLCKLRGE